MGNIQDVGNACDYIFVPAVLSVIDILLALVNSINFGETM